MPISAFPPRLRHRRRGAPPPQAAPGRRLPPLRPLRLRRRGGRSHHRPRPGAAPTTSGSTRSAMHFAHIRVSDLMLINDQGEVVEGGRPVNQAAFAIHSQVHAARPDVVAAAHSHSIYGKAWSTLGRLARPAHAGRLRLLRRPRALRRLHRRRPRHRGGQAHRPRPRRPQGRHPPEPRAAHRGPHRRRGGLVVHRHGPLLPGPAAGRGGRHARPHRRRRRRGSPPARSEPPPSAGSTSSPSTR